MMINEKIKKYLEICGHQQCDSSKNDFILKAIEINETVYNDSEVYTVISRTVFPEMVKVDNINVTLFSVNYLQYVEHLYSNLRFILFLSDEQQDLIDQIYKNITSDSCHLLSVLNSESYLISQKYIKKSSELFDNPNISRGFDEIDYYFYIAKNLFILRHEANHGNLEIRKYKNGLNAAIKLASDSLEKEQNFINRTPIHVKLADKKLIKNSIQLMLQEEEDNPLYVELLCDYSAFMNVIVSFESIDTEHELKDKIELLFVSISIFDYISDFYRRVANLKNKNCDPTQFIRPSINRYLYILLCVKFFEDRKMKTNFELKESSNKLLNGVQDIFVEEMTKILLYLDGV